jgi:hypothetical protein
VPRYVPPSSPPQPPPHAAPKTNPRGFRSNGWQCSALPWHAAACWSTGPQLAPSTAVLILSSLAGTSAYQLWRPRGAYAYMTDGKDRKTKMTCFGASSMPYNDTRGRARLPSVHCLSCLTRRPVARCCMGPRWREPRSEIGGGWFRVQAGRNVRRSLVARSILGLAASRPKLGKSYFVDRRLLSLTVQHKPLSVRFTLGSFWGRAPL